MICSPGTLRTRDPKGRPLCLAPGAIFPVIVRHHRPSGEIWSEIQILPNRRRVVVAENPERLARRIGRAIRATLTDYPPTAFSSDRHEVGSLALLQGSQLSYG